MGEALRGDAEARGGWRRARARVVALALALAILAPSPGRAQPGAPIRLDRGRFTIVCYESEQPLARALLESAASRDTFPGLPRPSTPVLIALAPDEQRFREWIGPGAPEWGAAIAFPAERRIVMQGRSAGSDAGDPVQVLRHELAHLALHEALGDLAPRWFDEGYASLSAGEWGRDEVLATSLSLVVHGVPPLDSLDAGFQAGAARADAAYALSYRAVAEMASLDAERGLSLLFAYWPTERSLDRAVRAAYGITLAGFEKRWQERTMRRYGGLAVLANVTLAAGILALVVIPLYLARRRRDRARMQALKVADEAAERAERESALEELLRSTAPTPPPGADDSRTRSP